MKLLAGLLSCVVAKQSDDRPDTLFLEMFNACFMKKYFSFLLLFVLVSSAIDAQSVGDYRTTAATTMNVTTNWQRFNGTSWVTPTFAPGGNSLSVTQSTTTVNNNQSATLSAANSYIRTGQYVTGTGIATGTTVSSVSGTTLSLSQNATSSATNTLTFSDAFNPGGTTSSNGNTTNGSPTLTLNTANTSVAVGMYVSGNGIPIGTTISTVTSSTNFTMSNNATATANTNNLSVSFGAASITNGSASVTLSASYANPAIVAGMAVTGTGIPAGTIVQSVASSTSFTLSANATSTQATSLTFYTLQTTCSFGNGATSITLNTANSLLAVGMVVTGTTNIVVGTTITSISGTSIGISVPTTGAQASGVGLTFGYNMIPNMYINHTVSTGNTNIRSSSIGSVIINDASSSNIGTTGGTASSPITPTNASFNIGQASGTSGISVMCGRFTVAGAATLGTSNTSTSISNTLIIYGGSAGNAISVANGGTVDFTTATGGSAVTNVTFTTPGNTTIASTTNTIKFNNLVLNMGGSQSNTLDMQAVFSMANTVATPSLTLTSGTLKISGASTLTPFGGNCTSSANAIPTAAGLYLNNSSAALSWGTAVSDGSGMQVRGALTIANGSLSIQARYDGNGVGNLNMSGGSLTIPSGFSLSNNGAALFHIGGTHVVNITGGTINIGNRNTGSYSAPDIYIGATSWSFTGGTLNVTTNGTVAFNGSGKTIYNLTIGDGTNSTSLQPSTAITIGNALTINSNASFSVGTNAVSVAGNWVNNGTYTTGANTTTFNGTSAISGSSTNTFSSLTIAASSILTSAAGNINISGTFTNSGTFTHNSGTVTFNGTTAQTVPALNYYNLTLSGAYTSNNNLSLASSGTIGIAGAFNPSATFGTGNYVVTGSTVNFNVTTGGQTIPGFSYNNLTLSNSSGTNTASGAITSSGTLTTTAGGTLDMSTFDLGVNTITNGGTITTSSTSATPLTISKTWGGTVTFAVLTGGQTIPIGTYTTLNINNTSGSNASSGGAVNATTLNTAAGGVWDLGTSGTLGGTLSSVTINGTVKTQNTTTPFQNSKTYGGTGTLEFNGTSAQAFTGSSTTIVTNIKVSNTSGLTLTNSLTINGTLTVNSGCTFNLQGNAITAGTGFTPAISGTLQTQATLPSGYTWGGTVQYNAATGQNVVGGTYNNLDLTGGARTLKSISATTDTIYVQGNYTAGSSTTVTGSTVVFNGSGAQSIDAAVLNAANFNNIGIRKSGTTNALTLITPVSVSGMLTLTSGRVLTTAINLLSLTNTSTTTALSAVGTTASYIDGPMARTFATTNGNSYTFPIGNYASSTDNYYPLAVTTKATAGATFTVTATAVKGNAGGTANATVGNLSTNEYWTVQTSATNSLSYSITTAALGSYTVIAQSSGVNSTGSYANLGGSASGNSINNSNTLSTASGTNYYFVAATPGAYYWVGGFSNNWDDANNWSSTSGGSGGSAGSAPQSGTVVYFDANSQVLDSINIASTINLSNLNITNYNAAFTSLGTNVSLSTNVLNITSGTVKFYSTVNIYSSLNFTGSSSLNYQSYGNSYNLTFGNGGTFTVTGGSASAYLDGNGNANFLANYTGSDTFYFNPSALIWSVKLTKGNFVVGNSLSQRSLGLSATTNSPVLALAANATLNLGMTNSSSLSTALSSAGGASIDASATGSVVNLTSSHANILNNPGKFLFKENTVINSLVINTSGNTYFPTQSLTVNSLTLTAGSYNNSTNNISISNGGTLVVNQGSLTQAPTFGTSVDLSYVSSSSSTVTPNGFEIPTSSTVLNNLSVNATGTSKTIILTASPTVNGTLTVTSGNTLDLATNTLSLGGSATVANSGTIKTSNTGSAPIPTGKTWGGTVQFALATGGQTVPAGTYNSLTLSNTSNSDTASGALTVNGTLTTTSGGTFDMGTFALSGTLTTITNGGTTRTSNTSASPYPTGKTWTGTVQFASLTGGQTVPAGTFTNLTLSNTSGSNTASGAITSTGTLTTTAGGTFNMSTFDLSVSGITNGGTINTNSTSSTPLTSGKTYGGTVQYGVTSGGQTIVAATYTTLTLLNNTSSSTSNYNVSTGTVNATTLNTTTGGTWDMGTTGTLGGTLSSVTNNGTIRTANSSVTNMIPNSKVYGGTGTIEFYGNAAQSLTTSGTMQVNNLLISNTSAGGLSLTNSSLTINGTLTVNAGSVFNVFTQSITAGTSFAVANSGTILTQSGSTTTLPTDYTWGGTVKYNSTTNNQFIVPGIYNNLDISGGVTTNRTFSSGKTYTIQGDFTAPTGSGSFTTTNSKVIFSGNTAQTITNPASFDTLTISKTGTANALTLNSPITVSKALNLTSGRLTSSATNTVTVSNTATAAITGGSSTAYVDGPLTWTLATSATNNYTFPVGNYTSADNYLPVAITSNSAGGNVTVTPTFADSHGTNDATLTSISHNEYWKINAVSTNTLALSLTPSTLGSFTVIGKSVTVNGSYSSIGGLVSSPSISATNVSMAAGTDGFFVVATFPPATISSVTSYISGVASGSFYPRDTLTITGTNFQSTSTVTVGGQSATLYDITGIPTTLKVIVSASASTGTVTVGSASFSGTLLPGYVTVANGSWNTGSTWLGGAQPSGTVTATVNNAVTLASSISSLAKVTINSGASLTTSNIGFTFNSGGVLINNGTLSIGNTANYTNATITNNGTFTLSSSPTFTGTSFTNNATANITGGPTFSNTSSITNNGKLTMTGGGSYNGTITNNAGDSISITTTSVNVTGTVTNNGYFKHTSTGFYVGGNLTLNGTSIDTINTIASTGNGTWTFTTPPYISGSFNINNTVTVTGGYPTYASTSTINYNNGIANSIGTEWKPNVTSGAGIPGFVQLGSTAGTSITLSGSNSYTILNRLTISSGCSGTVGTGSTLNILSSNAIVNSGTLNVSGLVQSAGQITNNSLFNIANGGKVQQFGGNFYVGATATVNIGATLLSATADSTTDASLMVYNGYIYDTGTINNFGYLRKALYNFNLVNSGVFVPKGYSVLEFDNNTNLPTASWPSTSTIYLTGATSNSISGNAAQAFGNVVINNTAQSGFVTPTGFNNVQNMVILNTGANNASNQIRWNNTTNTWKSLQVGGSYTLNGQVITSTYANVQMAYSTNSLSTTVTGDFVIGTNGNVTSSNSTALYIGGNFLNNGSFSQTTGSTNFNNTVAQTIDGSGTTSFYNLVDSNAAGVTALVPISTNLLTIKKNGLFSLGTTSSASTSTGTVTVDTSATLRLSSVSGGSWNAAGASLVINSGGKIMSNGTSSNAFVYVPSGSATLVVSGTANPAIIDYLSFGTASAPTGSRNISLSTNVTVSASNGGTAINEYNGASGSSGKYDACLINGNTLTLGTAGVDFTVNVTNSGTGNFLIKASNSSTITSNLVTNGNTGNIGTIQLDNGSTSVYLNNLTVNGSNLTLTGGGNPTVNGTLALTSGKLNLSTKDLVLTNNASVTVGTGYVVPTVSTSAGRLVRNSVSSSATLFPVGTSSYYAPVTLTNTTGTPNIAVYVKTPVTNTSTLADATKIVDLEWNITGGSGVSTSNVTYQFNAANQISGFSRSGSFELGLFTSSYTANKTVGTIGNGTLANSYTLTATGVTIPASGTSLSVLGNLDAIKVGCTSGTWIGSQYADANLPSNWCGGVVPTSGVISSNAPKMTSNLQFQNLTLNDTLNLNGFTLTINGNLTGTGVIKGSLTSGLMIKGPSTVLMDQTTNGTTNALGTFTVNTGASSKTVTLGNNMVIIDSIVPTSGKLDIGNNTVTLRSSSISKSAIVGYTGATITYGSGSFVVERYIPLGYRAYRDLAAGVANAGSIYKNWQEGGAATSGYGMFITGGTTDSSTAGTDATTGLDKSPNGIKSLYIYKTWNGSPWSNVGNTKDSNLSPYIGYRALIRGDRSFSLFTTPVNQPVPGVYLMMNATRIRATGSLVTGNVVFSTTGVTNSVLNESTVKLSSSTTGFSSVANPYVAPIDWNNIVNSGRASGLSANYYYLDPTVGISGAYVSYNANSGPSNGNNNIRYIQAGQAIYVENTGTSPVLTITEADKWVTAVKTSVFGIADKKNKIAVSLKKDMGDAFRTMDMATVVFDASFSNEYGQEDARKLTNPSHNISIAADGRQLAIDGRKPATDGETIAINLAQVTEGQYRLDVDLTAYQGLDAYLTDVATGLETKLDKTNANVSFTVTKENANSLVNRFVVKFKAPATIAASTELATPASNLKVFGTQGKIQVVSSVALSNAKVLVYGTNGKLVSSSNMNGTTISVPAASAAYVVKLVNGDETKTFKVAVQ